MQAWNNFLLLLAAVAESVDAWVSKTHETQISCEFNSHPRHKRMK